MTDAAFLELLSACDQLAESHARALRAVQNLTSASLEGRGYKRRGPARVSGAGGKSVVGPRAIPREGSEVQDDVNGALRAFWWVMAL